MTKQERHLRTHAIVLRRRIYREADWMLTLFSPTYGKFDAVAHGARKITSRKTGHVELFACVDILINRRKEPGIVSQVELIEPFLPMREDLVRGAYATYAVELLDKLTQFEDTDAEPLYQLFYQTLSQLCTAPDPRLVLRYYELHLMEQAGFRPELNDCVMSGEPIEPVAQFFSYADGGVVSPKFGQHSFNFIPISFNALKLLRHMQRSPFQQVASLRLEDSLLLEVEHLLLGYITHILETHLQSVDFIRRVRRPL
jgi:DNA repair protein RecO (recombination protein O)